MSESATLTRPAGSQGPGATPNAVVQSLDLALRRRVSGLFPGDQRASGIGPGSELAQLRPYQPGDDVRLLDPAATARTQVPHIRLNVPERTLTTWVVLDVSASMAFGTADRLKADVAEGIARVVGRLSVRRGNRVALLRSGAGTVRLLPPRGGRGALAALERALGEGVAVDGTPGEGLVTALGRVQALARRTPGLVVVISDFSEGAGDHEPAWRKPLAGLRARHDVLAVEVRDRREEELPDVGHLWLVDPETGRQVQVDTSSRKLRERFAAEAARRHETVATTLRRSGARHAVARTDEDWLRPLRGGDAMSFQSPIFLAALLIVPFVVAAYVVSQRHRRQYAVRFAALETLASVLPKSPGWRRHLPPALLCTALAALAVALARPEISLSVPVERAQVMLVTDVSSSMEATDVAPSRLQAAQQAAGKFLDKVPKSLRVGAVAFSQEAATLSRPTTDRDALRTALGAVRPGGGTATGNGIRAALNAMRDAKGATAPGAIILLSDGQATSGVDPIEQARIAKQRKIPIYTVALGTATGTITRQSQLGVPESIPVPPDPAALQDIARTSGGKAFDAASASKLSTVYESLSARLGTRKEPREITAGFAGGALVLVLLAGFMSLRWFGRLP